MKPLRFTTPVGGLLLAALYVITGLLGKRSSFMGGEVALVWPPAGIGHFSSRLRLKYAPFSLGNQG